LKAILAALFDAWLLLLEVLGFLLFFFCMFGAMGINLFSGALTHKCAQFDNKTDAWGEQKLPDGFQFDSVVAKAGNFPMEEYVSWATQAKEADSTIIGFERCPIHSIENCELCNYAADTCCQVGCRLTVPCCYSCRLR
jgi:hypothetical protein